MNALEGMIQKYGTLEAEMKHRNRLSSPSSAYRNSNRRGDNGYDGGNRSGAYGKSSGYGIQQSPSGWSTARSATTPRSTNTGVSDDARRGRSVERRQSNFASSTQASSAKSVERDRGDRSMVSMVSRNGRRGHSGPPTSTPRAYTGIRSPLSPDSRSRSSPGNRSRSSLSRSAGTAGTSSTNKAWNNSTFSKGPRFGPGLSSHMPLARVRAPSPSFRGK